MSGQRGFALLELIVAALIATLLAVWGAGTIAHRLADARAQAVAVWMLAVRDGVRAYILRHGGDMAQALDSDALATHGYHDWQKPTLAEMKAQGLLSQGFPEYGAGALPVAIQLLPGPGCPGAGCVVQALVHSARPMLHKPSGRVDEQLIAQWLLAAGGAGGVVSRREPAKVVGAAFGFPNPPVAGAPALPVGTIAMAVTAEQLAGAAFLRVRDDRNPDFQGSASVREDIDAGQSVSAGQYLYIESRHDILSPCQQEGAIATGNRRGLVVCQQGAWRSAGFHGGGFSTNNLYGCQAANGSSTANPVTGGCSCPVGYAMVSISDSGDNAAPWGRTRGFLCLG